VVESRCGQTTAKPRGVQAKKAPRDDSAEFRGEYGHAKVMYNIFNQVCLKTNKQTNKQKQCHNIKN